MAKTLTTYRKRLKPLFRHWDDPEIPTQLIRMMVLYEDLRLEYNLFYADEIKLFDEVQTRAYRRMYVLRRIYATILEVWGALTNLDRSIEFKRFLEKQRESDQKTWKDAVRFFNENFETIRSRRQKYGGHFDRKTAEFVRDELHEDTEGTVVVMRDTTDHTANVVMRFTMELVGQASMIDKPDEANIEQFVKGSHRFLDQIMRHASNAIEVVLYGHVWEHFGIERRKQIEVRDTTSLRARKK